MAIKAVYTGQKSANGEPLEHYYGVPARDLQDDEYDALTDEQRALVDTNTIYRVREHAAKRAASSPPPESSGAS